jgi:hypothetical protein
MIHSPHITDFVDVLVEVILRAEIDRAPTSTATLRPENSPTNSTGDGDGKDSK